MTDWDEQFADLRAHIAWPEEPDVASRLAGRMGEQTPSRGRSRWWRLPRSPLASVAIGAALALVIGASVLAVSQPARSAALEFLGIKGIHLQRAHELPIGPSQSARVLGPVHSLDDAQARVRFRIVVPRRVTRGSPARVRLSTTIPGSAVSLLYGVSAHLPAVRPHSNVGLLLTEFNGAATPYIDKVISRRTRVSRVNVNGHRGYWIHGGTRVVVYRDTHGLIQQAGLDYPGIPLLIWEQDGLALRLQARVSRTVALSIARSVR